MFWQEFIHNKVLQWALGAQLLNYFYAFVVWVWTYSMTTQAVENFDYVCPPHFQDCGRFYIFEYLTDGYSYTGFYMLLFALLLWCVYLFSQKKWQLVLWLMMPLFLWHTLVTTMFVERIMGNFDYYVIAFGVVLLFLPHKEFFLKLTIVTFYVISTVAKNHPAWIAGDYFHALRTGLPIFPDWSIPLWTNLVIMMEMVGAWFLMSKHKVLQRSSLTFFTAFHIYSGFLVAYRYPSIVLPMLLILFGPWYRHTQVPLDKKSIAGWTFIIFLFVGQFTPRFVAGDDKLTFEGTKYGLSMFESNHQCISDASLYLSDGRMEQFVRTNPYANERCNPYVYWFQLKQMCERRPDVERISWTFDHSINGDPFLRTVDIENVCDTKYRVLRRNLWIKTHDDAPESIGFPVQNRYY